MIQSKSTKLLCAFIAIQFGGFSICQPHRMVPVDVHVFGIADFLPRRTGALKTSLGCLGSLWVREQGPHLRLQEALCQDPAWRSGGFPTQTNVGESGPVHRETAETIKIGACNRSGCRIGTHSFGTRLTGSASSAPLKTRP